MGYRVNSHETKNVTASVSAGKQGCYLDGSLYSPEHSQAHNCPGCQQTAHHVRVERASLVNRVCDVQSVTVPEV